MRLLHRQAAARRTMGQPQLPSPGRQPGLCCGSWALAAMGSIRGLIPWAQERVCAFGRVTTVVRFIAASVAAPVRMLPGAVTCRAALAVGAAIHGRSFSRTIFSMVASQAATIVRQRV